MFCKYCGRKMINISEPCTYCKRSQGELQATNGYFGILNLVEQAGSETPKMFQPKETEEPQTQIRNKAMERENAELKRKIQRYEQVMQVGRYSMIFLGAITLVGFLVMGLLYGKSQKNIEKLMIAQEELNNRLVVSQSSREEDALEYEKFLLQKESAWVEELDTYKKAQEELKEEHEKELLTWQSAYLEQLQEMQEMVEEYHKDETEVVEDGEPVQNEDTGSIDSEGAVEGRENE